MAVDQTDVIDFVTIDRASGDLWLTISDHLPWDENETSHLEILQSKLNAYLRFIESGEVLTTVPEAKGKTIVINLVGRFPLSKMAESFIAKASATIKDSGFRLQFELLAPIEGAD